ncbi:MAG TPA: hypothetical protein VGJ21_18500 [Terracidiphilus sp.]|jgi:hypothetical protein
MVAVVPNSKPGAQSLHAGANYRLGGASGVWLSFFWGLAEGTFFFAVPDVWISLEALIRPARTWRHVLAATTGALVAGMLLYNWSARHREHAQSFVEQVPFVRPRMVENVHRSYQKRGIGAIFLGPLTGTPYKIYAVEAPAFMNESALLLATIPARAERFLLVWGAFGAVGSQLRRRFETSNRHLIAGHGCFWVFFYALYWGMIVLR